MNAQAIDPEGCACTDCLTGCSVPVERMTRDLWGRWALGLLVNRSSLAIGELMQRHRAATDTRAGVLGDFPVAGATIQFKGTDICVDIRCECGEPSHFDGYFAYAIECGVCGKRYDLSPRVALEPFSGQYSPVVTFAESGAVE